MYIHECAYGTYGPGSSLCFFLVAHQFPAALRSMWGHMAEELADGTWKELQLDASAVAVGAEHDLGLGLLLRMTRRHDLGLRDLLFPDQDV